MRRREFVARAQQPSQMRRIGVLMANRENDPESKRMLQALLQGLKELGWKPGINLQIEIRYGEGQPERIAGVGCGAARGARG